LDTGDGIRTSADLPMRLGHGKIFAILARRGSVVGASPADRPSLC